MGGGSTSDVPFCKFRNDRREALSELFVQVLSLCRDAGIAKLGHVALDGRWRQGHIYRDSYVSGLTHNLLKLAGARGASRA